MRAVLISAGDLIKPAALTKRVFQFDRSAIARGLPPNLVGCPYVTRGGAGGRLVNEHVRARFLRLWNPKMGREQDRHVGSSRLTQPDEFDHVSARIRGKATAMSSLIQVCRNVDDFVGWWEAMASLERSDDIAERLSLVREDTIESYGDSMGSGEWSVDGAELSSSTIRSRQIDAIQFLRWAKNEGMAPNLVLSVIERGVQVASYSGAKAIATGRSFSVVRRQDPRIIQFPEEEEVRAHVLNIPDPAVQLGALLIYGCGLRLSEVVNLRKNCIRILRSGSLKYIGVKGKGSKFRLVELERFIADQIEFFLDFERAVRASNCDGPVPDRLLLRSDGTLFPPRALYRAFRRAGPVSPHIGRHWYAVNFLLQAVAQRGIAPGTKVDALSDLLQPELIRLQRNLGHAHIDTTTAYLVSLNQHMAPVNLFISFEGRLNVE